MAQRTAPIQTFTCMECQRQWSRPTARGQRPKWCPDCRAKGLRERECPACHEVKPIPSGNVCCSRFCGKASSVFYVDCQGGCGRVWTSRRPKRRTCRRCRVTSRPVAQEPSVVWVTGPCRRCGEWFTTYSTIAGRAARYCSRSCSRNDRHGRKRAADAGATVEPFDRWRVFEDNNWTCWLCREPIDRTLTDPLDADYGTIDHVVPLGGDKPGRHAIDNLLPAHRVCNSIKGIESIGMPY
jgi:5-methylcytosine-specific restriction endonuclease McrA